MAMGVKSSGQNKKMGNSMINMNTMGTGSRYLMKTILSEPDTLLNNTYDSNSLNAPVGLIRVSGLNSKSSKSKYEK